MNTIITHLLLTGFAAAATVCDIKTRKIPNKLILIMLTTWFIAVAADIALTGTRQLHIIPDSLIGCAAGGGIFLLVYAISKKGLGGGDVKFMAASGLYLGLGGTIPAILYGSILAALTGAVLILLKRLTKKDKIPFAPFLSAGILITIIMEHI